MLKKKKKKILYEKWKEEHQIEQDREVIGQAIEVAPQKIVVNKVTLAVRIMQIIGDIIGFILKLVIVVVLLMLLTLAIVVLLNESLRIPVFEYIKQYIYIR